MKIALSKPKEFYIKIIVIFFIILMCILIFAKLHQDTNPTNIAEEKKNALFSMVQKNTNAKITKFATYGTHFNLSGTLDIIKVSGIKVNYVDLIIKTLDGNEISIKTDFKCTDNSCSFSTSTNINEGLNLETLDLNNYYFFIKVTYSNSDIQYYSLENNSEYSDIEYYTITKNNSNNKINISFKNYNNIKYMYMSVEKSSNLPDSVYDVAIDPSHGGLDKGSTSGEYTEANIVLNYGLKLKSELENLGLKVYISRDANSSPTEDTANNMYSENGRINNLNSSHAKLLISLQINSNPYDKKSGGIEVNAPTSCNLDFASLLAKNLVDSSSSNYSSNTHFKKAERSICT